MILILVVNGPNINMLKYRNKKYYGDISEEDIREKLEDKAKKDNNKINWWQGNSQGQLIDFMHNNHDVAAGLIINPAGYSHTSIAIKDCLDMLRFPIIEVHISNPVARNREFLTASAADAVIMGMGIDSYLFAYNHLIKLNK